MFCSILSGIRYESIKSNNHRIWFVFSIYLIFKVFFMNKLEINVKDQFGQQYKVEATLDDVVINEAKTHERIKYIIVESEIIRPNFEMFFESEKTGKIYKILRT